MSTTAKVLVGAVPIIAILVAAAFFTPPHFPLLARQVLLLAWAALGILVAERVLFKVGLGRAVRSMGLVGVNRRAVLVATLVSVPMWLSLPIYGWATDTPIKVNRDWLAILIGVLLVNGLAEEIIHRAFVFGHLRQEGSFAGAAWISAAVFAAQHLYLIVTMGTIAGAASIVLALLLAFPLAFIYERGGNSIVGPAILHTSSNAPMMLFVTPAVAAQVILPYMAIVLASIYLVFVVYLWLDRSGTQRTDQPAAFGGRRV